MEFAASLPPVNINWPPLWIPVTVPPVIVKLTMRVPLSSSPAPGPLHHGLNVPSLITSAAGGPKPSGMAASAS